MVVGLVIVGYSGLSNYKNGSNETFDMNHISLGFLLLIISMFADGVFFVAIEKLYDVLYVDT